MMAAGRPRLRRLGGGNPEEDTVVRRQRFEAAHPEITLTPPGAGTAFWTARRDGEILASHHDLGRLLDALERLTGEQP
jgi:hypothetical protein